MINKFFKSLGIQFQKKYWVHRIGWVDIYAINEYKYKYTKVAYMIIVDQNDYK